MAHSTAGNTWSSKQFSHTQQFARWREAVCDTHLAWDIAHRRESAFTAELRSQSIGAASLIECVCEPCSGRRWRGEIARADGAYYGVLYLLGGREWVRQGGKEAWLTAGDFVLWDSTRPIEFAIDGTLHKITLLLPQQLLDTLLPNACTHVGHAVRAEHGCSALFTSHLRSLAREGAHLSRSAQPALLDATLELLSAALEEAHGGALREQSLPERAHDYIAQRLGDPALNPRGIASALGISVRQLHRAFEAQAITVERWIWRERLQRCHAELLRPASDSISQIAFKWGFSDAAHFSRAYHEAFGRSPRETRRRTAAAGRTSG